MKNRISQFTLLALLAGSGACFAVQPGPAVFDNVRTYFASGPVALLAGQTASVCATNLDDSPAPILIGLLAADTSNLLASNQQMLQPGMGICVSYTRSPNATNFGPNVVGVVIQGGRVQTNGSIFQFAPGGGGCIVASLQIQVSTLNNIPAQTMLYVPMPESIYKGNGN